MSGFSSPVTPTMSIRPSGRDSVDGSTLAPSPWGSPHSEAGTSPTSPPSRGSQSYATPAARAHSARALAEAIIEEGQGRHCDDNKPGDVGGWPRLARKMVDEAEFQSFSRFRSLNLKTLLYYQVELAKLEEELREQEIEDYETRVACKGDPDSINYTKYADQLVPWTCATLSPQSPKEGEQPHGYMQWQIILRIRRTLRDYNEALLQYTQISKLPSPPIQSVKTLAEWLERRNGGNNEIQGKGVEAWQLHLPEEPKKSTLRLLASLLWNTVGFGKKTVQDACSLVLLLPRENGDEFSIWIKREFMPFWIQARPRCLNNTEDDEIQRVRGENILRFTSIVATMIACALPVAGIAVLATVKPLSVRIGIIAAFSLLVSGSLLLIVKCDRMNVFMVTAAFSAVLVVFVQNG